MMQGKTIILILGAVAFSVADQPFLKPGAQPVAGLRRLAHLLSGD